MTGQLISGLTQVCGADGVITDPAELRSGRTNSGPRERNFLMMLNR